VIGYSGTDSGTNHAFLWYGGEMTDLGALPQSFSYGSGINDRGQVVGMSHVAFLWERGEMTSLHPSGHDSQTSAAQSINNRGQVSIQVFGKSGGPASAGYVWNDGDFTRLATLGG